MPLFRFHRGGLSESLITTIIVKNKWDLKEKLYYEQLKWRTNLRLCDFEMQIQPYPDESNNFDARIGWYTQIIMVKMQNESFHPIGFLSEPLDA